MKQFLDFLNYTITFSEKISISIKDIILLIVVLLINFIFLKFLKKIVIKKFSEESQPKFNTIFSYIKYLILIIICFVTLSNIGVNVSAILAGATALLLGVGLALQTFFQDIISGIMILIDQTIRVGDVIEIEGKIVKVKEVSLRTTKTRTVDNKTLIIPNHKYLTNFIFNWTQADKIVTEAVYVGVAYGCDTDLVKKVLLDVATSNKEVLPHPIPKVVFESFGDSSLNFKLIFSSRVSLRIQFLKSDLYFEIDKQFRTHNISIPFPQRDIHILTKTNSL